MPTPRDSTDQLPIYLERSTHSICPPDDDRAGQWSVDVIDQLEHAAHNGEVGDGDAEQQEPKSAEEKSPAPTSSIYKSIESKISEGSSILEPIEPLPPQLSGYHKSPAQCDELYKTQLHVPISSALDLKFSARYGIDSTRLIHTHNSSMLRAGSRFRGTQKSESQKYNVEVNIKTVDMSESFICGYLKIEGLTPEHDTLTTFFEGEIIGPKYTFQTRHSDWGASDKEDMKHWARFPAWRPLAKQAKRPDFQYKNSTKRENMFMRWKEKFLVPDHRVREISGASFEGFYYICFNQVVGTISGIYYHSNSQHNNNRFQCLEMEWINDRGCYGAMEFR